MRRYPTGVTVITVNAGDVHHGMTANAVAPVSLDPLLYLVCVDHIARAHDLIAEARHYVVNLLAEDQAELSRVFAVPDITDEERWTGVATHDSTLGARRIDGCMGYFDCRVTDALPGGDHTIYVGEVVDTELGRDAPPLVFRDRGYHRLAPL